MAHKVKCKKCELIFERDNEPCVKVGNRYYHQACYDEMMSEKSTEEREEIALYDYMQNLYSSQYDVVSSKRMIEKFRREHNFTYVGIRKTLEYWHEVKGNSIEKSMGRPGIVPYIYQDAHNYYLALLNAKQIMRESAAALNEIETIEVVIAPQPRKPMKVRLFNLGEEEGL